MMLIFDFRTVGNRLLEIRKKHGMTQADVAEAAGLSDRTYADIERGTVNMRLETLLKICSTLHITPDDILTQTSYETLNENELIEKMHACTLKDKATALKLLSTYLQSLD